MIFDLGHLRSFSQEHGFLDPDRDLAVNSCGHQRFINKDFTTLREKGRVDYQIIYLSRGRGVYELSGRTEEVAKGHIVLYRPGERQYYRYDHDDGTETYWIHFTGHGAEECLRGAGFGGGRTFYVGHSETIVDLFRRIITELQVKKPLHDAMSCALFQELLCHLGRKHAEFAGGANHTAEADLEKIIESMHSSYNARHSVRELAQQCHLSVYRFIHNFKSRTGFPPLEYLTRVRIEKAQELLANSALGISEISSIIGYENPLYFSRVFKKRTGVSPSSYRRSLS